MTEEITIVVTETIRDETVVHSPDTTAEVNDAIITTITVITTGIVPSVTTPISHAGPCAIVAKNPARVAVEAVNAKAETTISSAVIGTVVEVVKPSTITIGLALNARTPISPSVNNATVVKLLALVAVVAVVNDQLHVPQAVAEATVTETAAETVEAHLTEAVAETVEVGKATAVITARRKESAQAMHITVHHVIYFRANLSAKMRPEGVELLEC